MRIMGPPSGSLKRYRGMGALGDVSGNLVPGQSYSLSFVCSPAQDPNFTQSVAQTNLQSWSLFSGGQYLQLQSVTCSSDGSTLTVGFSVGPQGAIYSLTAIAAAMASYLAPYLDATLTPAGVGSGLTATVTQPSTLSLNPLSSTNLQTDWNALTNAVSSVIPSTPGSSTSPWAWALLAAAGIAGVVILSRVL